MRFVIVALAGSISELPLTISGYSCCRATARVNAPWWLWRQIIRFPRLY